MPTNVIMPALELAQETGKILRWIKSPGDSVVKGEPLLEIETDKVTVEIEAPASGVLRDVSASVGDVVAVGKTIAVIFAASEATAPPSGAALAADIAATSAPAAASAPGSPTPAAQRSAAPLPTVKTPAVTVGGPQGVSNVWRLMAERMTSSWTTVPHFYLVREVNVSRLK